MRPSKTRTLNQLLSIRPKSERQEIALLLGIYNLTRERAKSTWAPGTVVPKPRDTLYFIMSSSMKLKAIPTEEDDFALLLDSIFTAKTPSESRLALDNARAYIVQLVKFNETEIHRYWGKRGGRAHIKGAGTESLLSVVKRKALEAIRNKPARAAYLPRHFVRMIAERADGYEQLTKAQQKNRRDTLREILVRSEWLKSQPEK